MEFACEVTNGGFVAWHGPDRDQLAMNGFRAGDGTEHRSR